MARKNPESQKFLQQVGIKLGTSGFPHHRSVSHTNGGLNTQYEGKKPGNKVNRKKPQHLDSFVCSFQTPSKYGRIWGMSMYYNISLMKMVKLQILTKKKAIQKKYKSAKKTKEGKKMTATSYHSK